MDLRECYERMNGDYEGVLGRMMNKEALVQKFLLKFLDDTSYELLSQSLASGDADTAFRAAHTLKGVCRNLGITKLGDSSSDLTEALRDGAIPEGAEALFQQVTEDYQLTKEVVTEFQSQL